jgi:hypothetical protein
MKHAIAVAVVAMALSGGANAQVQPPQERINTALARAREVGIPVALLESKIAEGKAKGVSLERIAAAIERRQSALERASQALRGGADAPSTLAVSADAIESGVSEGVLREVVANSPNDRRNVAIAALTELVHQGNTPEVALGRVRDALKRGPDALSNLPAEAASGGRGRGRGQGTSGGQNTGGGGGAGADNGPPAAVPGPGKPPQAGRPEQQDGNPGRGNSGQPNSGRGNSDQPNSGRGRGSE